MKISNFKLEIIQLIYSKIIFFIAASIIIFGLNLTPLILQTLHSPPGRTFSMVHNNVQDFFFYQSLMNEGANGAILISDPYTTEPHQSSIIFAYFAWVGKLSKIFSLPYFITYHFVRIFLGIFFLLASFILILYLKVPHPRLTFLFFVFASPILHKGADGNLSPFMYFWTGIDPIRRVAYLPHHMAGGLMLVITIILLINHINSKVKMQNAKLQSKIQNYKYLLFATLLVQILAFVHTPSLFILLLILPPSLLIFLFSFLNFQSLKIKNLDFIENLKLKIENYIGLFVYWFIGLLSLLIMVYQTRNGFPWSQYIDWEKRIQFPLLSELWGALGILFPFALIGAVKAVLSKKFENILIVCWLFIPILFIPIAPKLNLSNIRLIQGAPYLPLAILAVLGIKAIEQKLSKFSIFNFQFSLNFQSLKIKNLDFISNFKFKILNLITLTIVIIFVSCSYPTLQWSLKDQIREYWPIFGNVYLDNRLFQAFAFINRNYPPKTITLATFYTGNYLPAYTHTVSFIGHFGYTYNIDQKQELVKKFYENKMTDEEVKDFIKSNKIDLVWQGPEEKPIYKNYLYSQILKPVYDKEEVTLYKIID